MLARGGARELARTISQAERPLKDVERFAERSMEMRTRTHRARWQQGFEQAVVPFGLSARRDIAGCRAGPRTGLDLILTSKQSSERTTIVGMGHVGAPLPGSKLECARSYERRQLDPGEPFPRNRSAASSMGIKAS